ncbi:hypothetical protein JIN84_13200 [Luteolibacter yonseiensis]|uniref:Lipoprotein n=1 Tax=Luteolibacter yonseiensis TaxID=1144680 RepID=A0A934VC39_9BACT|nr:hypothetical protein [Luteolibacter yonseiensis]MBK1816576.1 hypothetical protein [Luteolibacter yonseiensis]
MKTRIGTYAICLSAFGLAACGRVNQSKTSGAAGKERNVAQPVFITTEGLFQITGDSYIRVFRDENGLLNVGQRIGKNELTWAAGVIEPGSDWFIYAEKYNEAWVFQEDHIALWYEHEESSGIYGLFDSNDDSKLNPKIYGALPPAVMDRLPDGAKQKIRNAVKSSGVVDRNI